MRSTRALRPAAVALAVLLSASLAACQPTGNARCDANLKAQMAKAESYGYRIRCDATFAGVSGENRSVMGWADHKAKVLWLWPEKMPDTRVLRKVAWHEIGHVVWDRKGLSGTAAAEERWADGYAYCAEPIQGIGYASRPTSCASYR